MEPEAPPEPSPSSANMPRRKPWYVWAGLGLVLVLAVGVVLVTRPKQETPGATVGRTAEVAITKAGINPQVLQVSVGTQVTWTNNDDTSHQIAADPHPKDDSIPGFDKSIVLLKGDTSSHNFTKTGTYTYHDEKDPLNKAFQGTVVVK